jgi:hypothetical protein
VRERKNAVREATTFRLQQPWAVHAPQGKVQKIHMKYQKVKHIPVSNSDGLSCVNIAVQMPRFGSLIIYNLKKEIIS